MRVIDRSSFVERFSSAAETAIITAASASCAVKLSRGSGELIAQGLRGSDDAMLL
jgi:hypothetical protein